MFIVKFIRYLLFVKSGFYTFSHKKGKWLCIGRTGVLTEQSGPGLRIK